MKIILSNCTNNIKELSHNKPHDNLNINPNLDYVNYLKLAKTKSYNKINYWKVKSKIQILKTKNYKNPNINQSLICYMDWEKINNKSIIKLYSILNLQSLTLEYYFNDNNNNKYNNYIYVNGNKINTVKSHNEKASILNNNSHHYNDDFNLYNLLNEKLIKINDLHNWIIGLPNFKEHYITNNNGFIQNGWMVNYMNFKPYKDQFNKNLSIHTANPITLKSPKLLRSSSTLSFFPEKIIITKIQEINQTNLKENIKIKIIVNNFNLIKI